MKIQPLIKNLLYNLSKDDIIIFIGKNVCKESFKFKGNNTIYLYENPEMGFSFALGLAMCSKKRIFIFCSDDLVTTELSSILQMAISECSNLFLVLLISGEHQGVGKFPTLYKSIRSTYGLFFSLGFLVNDYTHFFNDIKKNEKELKNVFMNLKGPIVIFIKVDPGLSKDFPTLFSNLDIVKDFING